MELNQAAQTALMFTLFFVLILIGLFFLFRRTIKSQTLSITNAVQTSILVIGFFSLIIFGGSYYFVLSDTNPSSQPLKDALTITASFFGGFATLVAAYIASRLFNDWRDQKNHDTKTIYLNNAIQALAEIHMSLINCRSDAHNLEEISSKLILVSRYINDLSTTHTNLLKLVYSNLSVADKLANKIDLVGEYNKYDKYIYTFDIYNKTLLDRYRTYFYYYVGEYMKDKPTENISIFRSYHSSTNDQDFTHSINAAEVKKIISTKLDREIGGIVDYITYQDHISECIAAHEKIFSLCVEALRAK